jgi:hypothetical protein
VPTGCRQRPSAAQDYDRSIAPARPGAMESAAAAVDAFLAGGGSAPRPGAERPADPATRMFAAWSGQDAERVGRDSKALLAGLRAVGEDVRQILRDAVSGDPARHARAEARLTELKRLQAEAGLATARRRHVRSARQAQLSSAFGGSGGFDP